MRSRKHVHLNHRLGPEVILYSISTEKEEGTTEVNSTFLFEDRVALDPLSTL